MAVLRNEIRSFLFSVFPAGCALPKIPHFSRGQFLMDFTPGCWRLLGRRHGSDQAGVWKPGSVSAQEKEFPAVETHCCCLCHGSILWIFNLLLGDLSMWLAWGENSGSWEWTKDFESHVFGWYPLAWGSTRPLARQITKVGLQSGILLKFYQRRIPLLLGQACR